MEPIKGTTILCVRQGPSVVIGGDGQVTQGDTIMKGCPQGPTAAP